MLESLFRVGYVQDHVDQLPGEEAAALYRLIGLICRTDIVAKEQFEREYDDALDGLSPLRQGDADSLRKICMYFSGSMVSAVEVDSNDLQELYVKYQYVTISNRLDTWDDKLRTVVGLRPYRYRIPIALAYSAQVYDLRVTGPDSQFVYRHYLTAAGLADDLPLQDLTTRSTMGIRLDRDSGAPFTELHTRGLKQGRMQDVECVVEFEEIPPGALRRALVISMVSTVLTFVFAVAMPRAMSDNGGTDLAALLLAVPGFAATLVGLSTDRVQQSSLTAYGGLIVSAMVSLIGSVLYVYQSIIWRDSLQIRLSLLETISLPVVDTLWLVLALVSTLTTGYLATQSVRRMSRYLAALRRGQMQGSDA